MLERVALTVHTARPQRDKFFINHSAVNLTSLIFVSYEGMSLRLLSDNVIKEGLPTAAEESSGKITTML